MSDRLTPCREPLATREPKIAPRELDLSRLFALVSFSTYAVLTFWIALPTVAFGADRYSSRLTWVSVQTSLAAPDVKTFAGLCERLSKLPIDGDARRQYTEVSQRVGEFTSFEKYISDYQKVEITGKDTSLPSIRKRLSDSIIWKTDAPVLDKLTRSYLVGAHPASDSEMIEGDNLVWFDIFTDDSGTILGWRHGGVPPHFVTIIVNGRDRILSDDTAYRSLIEILAQRDQPSGNVKRQTTIEYKDGPKENRQGTMSKEADATVKVKNGMIFDVKNDAE